MPSYRSDYYGVFFMPEVTPGVDPGIVDLVVAGTFVDGTTEDPAWMPSTTLPAFIRLASPPDGLPKYEMIEVGQTWQTNDYAPHTVKNLRGSGELGLTLSMHGTLLDAVTNMPVAPPWLQLASSASGFHLGAKSTDAAGGAVDAVQAAPAPTATAFDVLAGKMAAGQVIGIPNPGSAVNGLEIVRITEVASVTSMSNAEYNGVAMGFSSVPVAAEPVYFPCQAVFDKRVEDSSPSFTILVMRPQSDAALIFTGCQAKTWEITDQFNTVGSMKFTMTYMTWGSWHDIAGTEPVIIDEPAYYEATWPCARVTGGAHFWYQDPTDNTIKRDTIDISDVKITWDSGLDRYNANTASQGVASILAQNKSSIKFEFTTLYNADFRDFLEACSDSTVSNSFPISYWQGTGQGDSWFFVMAAAKMNEDPGYDGDAQGNMAQKIMLVTHEYAGDVGTADFDGTDFVDTKFALGVF